MKTVVSTAEVNRVPVDAVNLALQKLPGNGQDETDMMLAKLFLLKSIRKQINPPLDKLEDRIKDKYRKNRETNKVIVSQNYRVECTEGSPRELFNFERFTELLVKKYPNVELHHLKEMYIDAKTPATAPVSIEIEYIGDSRAI